VAQENPEAGRSIEERVMMRLPTPVAQLVNVLDALNDH
jgi:hypothetical protein